jgi:hypothetical protein
MTAYVVEVLKRHYHYAAVVAPREEEERKRWALEDLRDGVIGKDNDERVARRMIDAAYKDVATKLHPDKGGSHEKMIQLNAIKDSLKRSLKKK